MPLAHYWTWTKSNSKKLFFWSNPYKIIKVIWLYNFCCILVVFFHRNSRVNQTLVTWPHLQYNLSHVIKFSWWGHGEKWWPQNLFQNAFILRRPRVDNFPDIIKMATMFIKTTFKDLKKVKRIKNFLIYKHCWCQQNVRGVSRDWSIF